MLPLAEFLLKLDVRLGVTSPVKGLRPWLRSPRKFTSVQISAADFFFTFVSIPSQALTQFI